MVIFKVKHKENQKVYVGYSVNDNESFMGTGQYINRALKDFGRESFSREVLEKFEDGVELSKVMSRLEYWIREHNADNPSHGYNESIEELIPTKKKLTKKIQVLLSPYDEATLNSIIIEKSMKNKRAPMSISKYVRQLIVEHIIEETTTEKQFKL
jgi:hypothetical protein